MADDGQLRVRHVYVHDEYGTVQCLVMVWCAKCNREHLEDDYYRHLDSCKGPPFTSNTVRCPHCPAVLSHNRFITHMNRHHRDVAPSVKPSEKTLLPGSTTKRRSPQKQNRVLISASQRTGPARLMVSCPKCGVSVRDTRLKRHLLKVHKTQQLQPPSTKSTKVHQRNDKASASLIRELTTCRECGVQVRADRLKRHMMRVHGVRATDRSSNAPKPGSTKVQAKTSSGCYSQRQADYISEGFRQSNDEPTDGSKYWGFQSREHGRFGSHPLIDDYSEEADP
jgi:phage FluMu protein Com